jgi:hypothetical protein
MVGVLTGRIEVPSSVGGGALAFILWALALERAT